MRIEALGPSRDIGKGPFPEGAYFEVLGDTGFRFTGRFRNNYFPGDSFSKGKDASAVRMQIHAVTEVPELFVHVEGLGSHVDLYMIMTLKLEEVADLGLEGLIVAVVPDHTDLIQQKEGVSFRDKITQVLYLKMSDTRHKQFFHVGIDNPALFEMLPGQLHKVGRFTGALLTKDKIELVGVQIFPGSKVPQKGETNQQSNQYISNHIILQLGTKPGPAKAWGRALFLSAAGVQEAGEHPNTQTTQGDSDTEQQEDGFLGNGGGNSADPANSGGEYRSDSGEQFSHVFSSFHFTCFINC
ncbi:hypothetical protein NE579_03565 [Intestinimonas massiliensis]|uniref:Uncharacterized protein n=1 Tax=Intestinimonas massiliensis (ex Afouda et al. 2020) TaxID=1673721 RepID=A0AAW5JLW8_9FIRM|nr:hypothetical protein [Intestinimonas massiliensis (ex Afouda et al. 2020)]MCQ4769546.1 hypothetical protein [Intestinimonas massiliensis (ex Afouda et al. 2020)]